MTARGRKRGKTDGKDRNEVREDGEKPGQGKGTKEREKKTCYYAELRASCFCPHLIVFLIRQAADGNGMAGGRIFQLRRLDRGKILPVSGFVLTLSYAS